VRARHPAGRWRSPRLAFAVALLLALLVTGGEGYLYHARYTPASGPRARVGETVTLAGTTIEVRSITVARELPVADAGDPPAKGPAGSVLVLVTWVQTLDETVDVEDHFCDAALVADDGTTWADELDYTYDLRRPKSLTCASTDDAPMVAGKPATIGESYVIPASYASRVRWRLSLDDDRHVVEFVP